MHSILVFLDAHHTLTAGLLAVLVYQPLSAIFTTIFRLQSPETYARFAVKHPALAQAWRVCGALGIDPVQALRLTQMLVTALLASKASPDTTEPKDPPTP